MSKGKLYVVTMYRFGDRERHSYVYGVYTKKERAFKAARKEQEYRGGNKYYPEVKEFTPDTTLDESKTVMALESNPDFVQK